MRKAKVSNSNNRFDSESKSSHPTRHLQDERKGGSYAFNFDTGSGYVGSRCERLFRTSVSSRLRLRVVSKKNRRFLFVETLGVEGLRLRLRLVPPLPIPFHSISVFIDDCHGSNGRLLGWVE